MKVIKLYTKQYRWDDKLQTKNNTAFKNIQNISVALVNCIEHVH